MILVFYVLAGQALGQSSETRELPLGMLFAVGHNIDCGPNQTDISELVKFLSLEISQAEQMGIPVRILMLGDYSRSAVSFSDAECLVNFRETWSELLPWLLPIVGDREWHSVERAVKPEFRDLLSETVRSSAAGIRDHSHRLTFPTRHPNAWTIILLNSYVGVRQTAWYAEEWLGQHDIGCRIAVMHIEHIGSIHDDRLIDEPSLRNYTSILSALVDADTTILLTNGNHMFQRHDGIGREGKPIPQGGVMHFALGTGSSANQASIALKPFTKPNKALLEKGFLKLRLFNDYFKWTFLSVTSDMREPNPKGEALCNRP